PTNPRVLRRVGVVIVVEIDPGASGAACLDLVDPFEKLIVRVIMTVPAFRAVQADIYLIRGSDEFIGKPRAAARAEDYASFAEGAVDIFIPPARMPELHNVAPRRVELADNRVQPRPG